MVPSYYGRSAAFAFRENYGFWGDSRQDLGEPPSNDRRMTKIALTRRDLARLAVAGTAGALLPATAQAQEVSPEVLNEGEALAQTAALSVGYALTATQAREVAGALKDYPGAFTAARAYDIPDDIGPAWTPNTPPAPPRKGRK